MINDDFLRKHCIIIRTTDEELPPDLVAYLEKADPENLLTQEEKEQFLLLLLKAKEMIDADGGVLKFSDELMTEQEIFFRDSFLLLQRFIKENYLYNPKGRIHFGVLRKEYKRFLHDLGYFDDSFVSPSFLREELLKVSFDNNNEKLQIKKYKYKGSSSYIVIGLKKKSETEASIEKNNK